MYFNSLAARVKMGKKVEKAVSKEKNHSSASHETLDEDPNKTPGKLNYLLLKDERNIFFLNLGNLESLFYWFLGMHPAVMQIYLCKIISSHKFK